MTGPCGVDKLRVARDRQASEGQSARERKAYRRSTEPGEQGGSRTSAVKHRTQMLGVFSMERAFV